MEKTITMSTLNAAIEAACNNLRNNLGWTDDECLEFAANLMENLVKDGWTIEDDIPHPQEKYREILEDAEYLLTIIDDTTCIVRHIRCSWGHVLEGSFALENWMRDMELI
jgi:hypothetical protein